MVMHHVPVERCADILESMSGTRPSDGRVHTLLGHAARAVAAANKTIRALIILAGVICGDETPLRAGPGPKIRKKYLQVACTNLLTCYFLGDRDLASFKAFVYSDLHGTVVVHDRYQSYDAFDGISRQLCCQHLLRDFEDAAQSYPGAIWPGQIAEALRGLIHQANVARRQGLHTASAKMTAEHLKLFRRGVAVGLSQVRRVPGAKSKQPPARLLLECLRHREADVLRFLSDTAIPPTSNQAERDLRPSKTQQKISGRPRSEKPPATGTPSADTPPPPPSTGPPSSPPSATPSPQTPGCRPSRPAPEPRPEPVTHGHSGITNHAARRECLQLRTSAIALAARWRWPQGYCSGRSLGRAAGRGLPGATVRARIPRVARSALSGITGKMAASFQLCSTADQS